MLLSYCLSSPVQWRGQNRHKEIGHLTDRTGHDCARPSARPKILVNWTCIATRVLQHPWGQRDSIMPRWKEDEAARKREERSARSADNAAARSADDAARKREERSARFAARQHRLQHRLAQEAAALGAAMTVAATVDDLTGLLEQ